VWFRKGLLAQAAGDSHIWKATIKEGSQWRS
jgi:hypothetical protein